MADNILSLIFRISADPAQAAEALKQIEALGLESAEGLKSTFQRIADSQDRAAKTFIAGIDGTKKELQDFYDVISRSGAKIEAWGEHGDRAAADLADNLGKVRKGSQDVIDVVPQMTGAFQEFGLQSSQSIKQMLPNLLTLRRLEFATLGLVSVGFYISEWQRVGEVIASAAKILGGYGEAEQEIMADAIKDNEKQIENYRQLNAAQLTQIGLIDDLHRRKVAELQFEIANAKISQSTFISQRESLQTQIDDDNLLIDAMQQMGFLTGAVAKAWVYYKEKVEGTGHALVKAEDNEKKAGLAILEMNRQLKDAEAAFDKATKKTHGYGRELDLVGVKIPPFIREIERLQTALQVPEAKVNNNIFAYAELNAKRLQEGLKPVEASFKELGIKLPKLKIDMAEALKVVGAPSPTGGLTLQQIIAGKYAVSEKELEANLEPAEKAMRRHVGNIQELQKAIQTRGAFAGENLSPLGQSLSQFNAHLKSAGQMAGVATQPFTQLQFHVAQLKQAFDVTGLSLDNFSKGMGKNIAQAIVYGDNIGKAMEKALKATVASIAGQALVQAIYQTALGVADLAIGDFADATLHFESAAIFGAVGGAAAAIGAAIPGGGAGKGSRSSAGSGAGSSSAATGNGYGPNNALAQGSRAPQYPQGGLTVAIMGNEEAGNWLATTLNKAVEQNGTRLVSSHTQSSPPIGQ